MKRTQFFWFDLQGVCETVRQAIPRQLPGYGSSLLQDYGDIGHAWLAEHLRFYHRLDMPGLLEYQIHVMLRAALNEHIDKTVGLTKGVYRLLTPMTLQAHEAAFVDMRLTPADQLRVTLYDDVPP
jgi:hypothetical protein